MPSARIHEAIARKLNKEYKMDDILDQYHQIVGEMLNQKVELKINI